MMIRDFIKTILLIDVIKALFVGIIAAFKRPVTVRNLDTLEKEYIKIDHERCIECGICINICPCEGIILSESGKIQIDPRKCASCGLCQKACPRSCIVKIKGEFKNN